MLLTVLTGFQVTWEVEPARGQAHGSVNLTVILDSDDLVFVRDDGVETASWEVAATIDGMMTERNSGAVGRDDLPLVETFTISSVPPGEHVLTILAGDLETRRQFTWEEDISVPRIDSVSWSSGSLQLTDGTYQRALGSTEVFWSVYPPEAELQQDTVSAAWMLRDHAGVIQREGWMGIEFSQGRFRCRADVGLTGLDGGEYDLLAVLLKGEEIVSAAREELAIMQAWDIWGDDPELTRSLVRPIASSAEISALEDAEGPSSRVAVMAEFWAQRDPTPGTVRNEYLEEYLERLDYIEEHFSVHSSLGIISDQGRVYALLGPPDMIEDMPLELSTLPSITWIYFSPPLEVVFIDHYAVGAFDLVTDWEEVRSDWEKL